MVQSTLCWNSEEVLGEQEGQADPFHLPKSSLKPWNFVPLGSCLDGTTGQKSPILSSVRENKDGDFNSGLKT